PLRPARPPRGGDAPHPRSAPLHHPRPADPSLPLQRHHRHPGWEGRPAREHRQGEHRTRGFPDIAELRATRPLRLRSRDPGGGDARGARESRSTALPAVSAPLEAVLFDDGHTLIYFDELPLSALVDAYEKVNQLLAETLERDVPAAHVLIEQVSRAVADEIQRDTAAARPRAVR